MIDSRLAAPPAFSETYVSPLPSHIQTPEMARRPETPEESAARRERYRKLAALIDEWAGDDPAYNERVGTLLVRELEEERRGDRSADDAAA